MLPIFVINLATSADRRQKITSRLEALKISFEVFNAVDGRQIADPLFSRYNDQQRIKYRRTRLSGGELGCFASHFKLWEKCVELNQPIIVMEDDVVVEDSFVEAICIGQKLINKLHYLRFSGISLHRRPFKILKAVGSFNLVDHIRGPAGTQCYALDPIAAKTFIEHAQIWFLPVDDYLDRYWSHGIDCYSLMPFPVKLADVDSDMIRNKKGKRPLTEKIKQEFYGRLERLRRTKYRTTKLLSFQQNEL